MEDLKKLCSDIFTYAKDANGGNLLVYIPKNVGKYDFNAFLMCMKETAAEMGLRRQCILVNECIDKYSKGSNWVCILDNMLLRLKYCDWN